MTKQYHRLQYPKPTPINKNKLPSHLQRLINPSLLTVQKSDFSNLIIKLFSEAQNLVKSGSQQQAITLLKQLVCYVPQHFAAWHLLGITYTIIKEYQLAKKCLIKSLEICPDFYLAKTDLINVYIYLKETLKAENLIEELLAEKPEFLPAWIHKLTIKRELCDREEVRSITKKIMESPEAIEQKEAHNGLEIYYACDFGSLHNSLEDEQQDQKRFWLETEELLKTKKPMEGIPINMTNAPFYIAYQNVNPRPFVERIVHIYRTLYPELNWVNPKMPQLSKNRKIKIAVVSEFIGAHHAVHWCYGSTIANLNQDKFDIKIFIIPGRQLQKTNDFDHLNVTTLPRNYYTSREILAAWQPDIIWYPEVPMSYLTYLLALARIAPVQCASQGHPITTGMDSIDYYFTGECHETEGSQDHYTEQLVKIPGQVLVYRKPPEPKKDLKFELYTAESHQSFDIMAYNRYLCCQSMFKINWRMDLPFRLILENDPKGIIILISSNHFYNKKIRDRFSRSMPQEVCDRIHILPKLELEMFFKLLSLGHVSLDTAPFGGGNTVYQALTYNVPVIGWEGQRATERIAKNIYQFMGIEGLIAKTPEEFAHIAVRTVNDPAFRKQKLKQIQDGIPDLYNDTKPFEFHNKFFSEIVELHRNKEK